MAAWRSCILVLACLLVAARLQAQVPDNAVWIDVRTPQEYAEGHLGGALSIPLGGIEAGVRGRKLPLDTPIYLYCGSGYRSGLGRQRLQVLGYTQVVNAGSLEDARKLADRDQTQRRTLAQ